MLNVQGAAGVVKVLAVTLEVFHVSSTDHGRFANLGALAFQAAEARPCAEREFDFIAIKYLKEDCLVAVVSQPRQSLTKLAHRSKAVAEDNHKGAPAEPLSHLLHGAA